MVDLLFEIKKSYLKKSRMNIIKKKVAYFLLFFAFFLSANISLIPPATQIGTTNVNTKIINQNPMVKIAINVKKPKN